MTFELNIKSYLSNTFKRLFLVLCASYFLLNCTFSQVDNYSIENFFIEEGFPVIRVLDINQDNNGLMWFCSEKQLHSFNGSHFDLQIEFSKSDFELGKILFDNNGNKWLLDVKQKAYYSFHSTIKSIKIYDENNLEINPSEYLGIDNIKIEKIYQSDFGTITIKINDKFYHFDKTLKDAEIPKQTKSFIFSNEKIAILNNPNGATIIDLESKKDLVHFENKLTYRARESDGILYIRFSNGEFHSYNITTNKCEFLSNDILKIDNSFSDFIISNTDDLWLIKLRSLTLYNIKNKEEIRFNKDNTYPARPYNITAFKDREENVWIGTNLGVNKITNHKNNQFSNSNPFSFSTRKIMEINEEELFVSTYRGNFIYNLQTSKYSKISEPDVIVEMFKEDDIYYSINRYNILKKEKLKPNKIIKEKDFGQEYTLGRYPSTLFKSSIDKKYLILYHEVYEFDNELNHKVVLEDRSNQVFYNKAYEFKDEIYLLSSKGIFICDKNFRIKNQILKDFSFQLLHQDNDNPNILWLSTTFELIKYNLEDDSFETFSSNTGFINTSFTAIKEDDIGNIWLPSYAGLNRFNKQTQKNQVYLYEEGISNNEFNQNSSITLSDGRLVLGSISGLTFIDIKNIVNEPLTSPEVNIYNCKMLVSNLTERLDLTEEVKSSQVLEFKEKYIESTIQLSHHSYTNLKSKQFDYRILKKDEPNENEPWTSLTSNEIRLGRMPYGEYLLQYQALSKYGNKVSKVNGIEVHYTRPFFKTSTFRILGLLLLVFGFYYFFQQRSLALVQQKIALETEVSLRTQQIQKQKQELENLISTKDKLFSILAHDLKSPLITLKNISGKINYLINKGQPNRIIEIGKTIEDKVSNLNIFLDNLLNWSLQQRGHLSYRPQTLSILDISTQILVLYQDLIQEKEIVLGVEIPVNATCYADENSIKTVIRNIIHNAIKYSPKGSTIKVTFRRGEEYNVLAISDMGAGIPQSIIDSIYKKEYIKNTIGTNGETGTGLGFLISIELMDLNKGKIVFITNKDNGTTVELMLPISEF